MKRASIHNTGSRTKRGNPRPPRGRSSGSAGFTLIELMIVVIVIGILAAMAIPSFGRMIDNAKESAAKTNMHTVQVAAEDYGVQNDGVYPATMDGTHLANLLPPSFRNPFSGTTGSGDSWEDRDTYAAPASTVSGIVSYSDSSTMYYNIKGYGKSTPINVTLTYGQ